MSNLERIGNTISVPIHPDEEGYIGRECPVKTCLGYFKITPGTGIKGPAPCHCPYCGHSGEQNTFFTPEQIEYAKSVALRKITDAIHQDLKSLEFDHKPRGPFGIGISMKVTSSGQHPIRYYREKNLETKVVCDKCTLRFAIYGVFGWCPDCGEHNSFQILSKNLELARKELQLSASVETDLAEHLVGDALENVVSAFDGFGREICSRKGADIRFQNIVAARRRVQELFGFDVADKLSPESWVTICRIFQKRHLLSHKMGVIDDEYVQKANDTGAVVGRRVRITQDEVSQAISLVETLGQTLFKGLHDTTSKPAD
jgi:hypothetical protein